MEADYFSDAYRPIGERFYAQRWSGPILYTQMPEERNWAVYGRGTFGHYSVGLDLSWFYAKLYVDRLNRIARICAGERNPRGLHVRVQRCEALDDWRWRMEVES